MCVVHVNVNIVTCSGWHACEFEWGYISCIARSSASSWSIVVHVVVGLVIVVVGSCWWWGGCCVCSVAAHGGCSAVLYVALFVSRVFLFSFFFFVARGVLGSCELCKQQLSWWGLWGSYSFMTLRFRSAFVYFLFLFLASRFHNTICVHDVIMNIF